MKMKSYQVIVLKLILVVIKFIGYQRIVPFLEYSRMLTPASNLAIARLCFKDVGNRGRLGQSVLYLIPTAVARIPPTTAPSSGSPRAR